MDCVECYLECPVECGMGSFVLFPSFCYSSQSLSFGYLTLLTFILWCSVVVDYFLNHLIAEFGDHIHEFLISNTVAGEIGLVLQRHSQSSSEETRAMYGPGLSHPVPALE